MSERASTSYCESSDAWLLFDGSREMGYVDLKTDATRIAAALNAAEDDGCSEEFWSWLFDNCEVTWQPKTVGNGTVISSQCVNDKSEQQQIRNKWAT